MTPGHEGIVCPSCGISFLVPAHWKEARRADKARFFCPNGHGQSFTTSTIDVLREKLNRALQEQERLAQEADAARNREHEAIADANRQRKAHDRIRKRVQGGACPDCNRTFANLARHMHSQHKRVALAVVPPPEPPQTKTRRTAR